MEPGLSKPVPAKPVQDRLEELRRWFEALGDCV
jgi:hypothetical protein